MYEIYQIYNKINSKVYIGITNQGYIVRFGHHLYEARSGSSFKIHRAIRKYGEENFSITLLNTYNCVTATKLNEMLHIKKFNSTNDNFGYNMTLGGDGTFGRSHSEETKDKIRKKAIGRKASPETKSKMKDAKKDFRPEQHVIDNLQKYNAEKRKVIMKYSKDGVYLGEYYGISEMCREFNYDHAYIYRVLQGKNKSAYGYIWKYKQEQLN